MKLIFKYLKPYIWIVLLIVGLTYGQVQTELTLPNYMSNIVTNGIQYGGIIEQAPYAVCKDDMDVLLKFVDNNTKQEILDAYTLSTKGSEILVKNQKVQIDCDVYFLKEDTDLSNKLERALVYAYLTSQTNVALEHINIDEYKKELDTKLIGLEDNISSMAKLYIQQLYFNVGLNTETIQTNYILDTGLKMLVIAAIGVVIQLLSTYLATKTSAKIAAKMRSDVFKKVESFSFSEFSKFSTSSLITRTVNDITKVQQLIQMMLRMMLMSPMMGITAVFKVSQYPSISWLLIVAICVIIFAMVVLAIFAVPKFEKIQKLTDKINSIMREFLDGMLVIRAFNSEKAEEVKFDDTNKEYQGVEKFVSSAVNIMFPIITLVMNSLTIGITWFAAKQIDMDVITIGDMMAFTQYAMHVVISFMMVTLMFVMIPRSLVSVKRISEVLNTSLTILDPENPKQLPKENGELEFKNVTFKYPGAEEAVLSNVNFKVKPGETLALIGSTGSGKSTVIKLIPRLFDVNEGSITYCGINIKDIKQEQLHDKIGYATQKAILFSGDIEENIKFGRDVSDEELNKAIEISQSRNIIEEKEDGIKALITQGGTNVSGGQKQRISIARTLAKNKNIYIFDDSFSALDYETDKKLRSALDKLIEKTKSTVIIVAQRISTIKNADKILVFENGKIVGEGKHEDLLKNCEVYKQIAYSQLSKEELA